MKMKKKSKPNMFLGHKKRKLSFQESESKEYAKIS